MGKLQKVFEPIVDDPVAFIIKGSPDPDAIAGSLALLSYYESLGGSGKIYYNSYISHSNNKAMVNVLGLSMEKVEDFSSLNDKYKHYVIVDHSNPSVEGISEEKCLLHVDHHKEDERKKKKQVEFTQIIELDAGSCSSIIVHLLNEEGYFSKANSDLEKVTTALAYGVRTDTDNLDSASAKDYKALEVIAKYYNKPDLKKISKARITSQTTHVLRKAYEVMKDESNWCYAGVGFLQETYRDSIATVADELMRHIGIDHVLVYAIIEREDGPPVVEGSVRSEDAGMDLDAFVKSFSDNAGGRKHKAGFRIPLGFWGTCTDKELLSRFVTESVEGKFKSILSTEK